MIENEKEKDLLETNAWLRHILHKDLPITQQDELVYRIELGLEQQIRNIEKNYKDHPKAKEMSVNLMMDAMLSLQKQYSPTGYRSMISSLWGYDPSFQELRSIYHDEFMKNYKENIKLTIVKYLRITTISLIFGICLLRFSIDILHVFFK